MIVWKIAPESEGHGTDAALKAYHGNGKIRWRVPFVKALSSIITISSGGSAGCEGPTAQISAGFGSILADIMKLSPRERRILALRFSDGKTQMEVSGEIGISQAQVSRLEKNAIKAIRKQI